MDLYVVVDLEHEHRHIVFCLGTDTRKRAYLADHSVGEILRRELLMLLDEVDQPMVSELLVLRIVRLVQAVCVEEQQVARPQLIVVILILGRLERPHDQPALLQEIYRAVVADRTVAKAEDARAAVFGGVLFGQVAIDHLLGAFDEQLLRIATKVLVDADLGFAAQITPARDRHIATRLADVRGTEGGRAGELSDVVGGTAAADAAAGTGIRTVGIFGISATAAAGTFTYYLETVTMAGATPVTTARYYKRIIAVIALTWGSGGKAAGAITVSEKGGTSNCYATLQANMNCTVNARFYLATGYNAAVIKFTGNHVATSTASTAVPLTVGTNARLIFQPDGSKADEAVRALTLLPVMQAEPLAYDREIAGDDTKYFTIKHQTLKQDANCDAHYHLKIAVWRTTRLNTNVMQI